MNNRRARMQRGRHGVMERRITRSMTGSLPPEDSGPPFSAIPCGGTSKERFKNAIYLNDHRRALQHLNLNKIMNRSEHPSSFDSSPRAHLSLARSAAIMPSPRAPPSKRVVSYMLQGLPQVQPASEQTFENVQEGPYSFPYWHLQPLQTYKANEIFDVIEYPPFGQEIPIWTLLTVFANDRFAINLGAGEDAAAAAAFELTVAQVAANAATIVDLLDPASPPLHPEFEGYMIFTLPPSIF